MTRDEFIELLNHPDKLTAGHIADLKEMISYYPYFAQAYILLAKAMLKTGNLHTDNFIKQTAIKVADRRNFYYFLYPEKKINTGHMPKERIPKYSGNYFDLIQAAENEGGDKEKSLKTLAERLKMARAEMMEKEKTHSQTNQPAPSTPVRIPTPDYIIIDAPEKKSHKPVTEEYVKILIKEKKYREAIEILNKLNLINPKKSIYFADQIRFLEKILVNSKK
ncbi:MAG: hypothetical protein JXR27_02990 [Paludibacteraceae bacterium]|nr:hypothetical protein [Paludibacteraceae bacterium]